MKTIHKYPIKVTDQQVVNVLLNHKFIHVGLDPKGELCLWAEVDDYSDRTVPVNVYVVGTGNPMPKTMYQLNHLGSLMLSPFMWHVYVEVEI